MTTRRFDVYWVALDPTRGNEIGKTRPCAVISPDEFNRYLSTVLVAPFTSVQRKWVSRVNCTFKGRQGQIALDQIRCVDLSRLLKRMGRIDEMTATEVRSTLVRMFG